MIYRLYIAGYGNTVNAATTVDAEPCKSFLFTPENPDYQTFKKEVLAGAELQDADGNVMPPEVAKAYVETLP